jgi:O-acetyl-ADP-ribose deacetylase (regulator of RNase III)
MIKIVSGNLLEAPAEALVNTVNTEGAMGKGIAAQFKRAFPEMFRLYEQDCKLGLVKVGKMHVVDLGGLVGGPRWIINFPTKKHWRAKSRIADIKSGLEALVQTISELQIRSIAIPPLGCGYGGLDWREVRPLIESSMRSLQNVEVFLYPPEGAPPPEEMPNRTEAPNMTSGRAALIELVGRYRNALLDPFVRLLEVHKLMYFLQEAGEPLKLNFSAHSYGPYSSNLRHVLGKLEGHWITGFGEGSDQPDKELELLPGAEEAARSFIGDDAVTLERMERVSKLISGFEDSTGMELLSTVHWVMCHQPHAASDPERAVEAVHSWSSRKARELKADHIRKAWSRLKAERWDSECRSAVH